MVAFLGECVAIARIQMLHQRAIVMVGFILCCLLVISPDRATYRTRYNFCRTSMHKLREIHPFQSDGSVTQACFDKPRPKTAFLFNFPRRTNDIIIRRAAHWTGHTNRQARRGPQLNHRWKHGERCIKGPPEHHSHRAFDRHNDG